MYYLGAWNKFLNLVREYVTKYAEVHVVVGPAFDYNSDGHADSLDQIYQHQR